MGTIHVSTSGRNAQADAIATLIGSTGTLKIYSGSMPATADTAVTGTLLATVTLGAFGSSSSGTVTGADPVSVNASATGTAGYFRAASSGGTTAFDGDVTVTGGGGVMTLASVSLVSGSPVDITSITVTAPAS